VESGGVVKQQPLCFFSVVRYVPDPIRNEAKNIGVLLICPEIEFGGTRFNLARTNLPPGSARHTVLMSIARHYELDLPATRQPNLFTQLPSPWVRNDLQRLHEECTNMLQFTEPVAAVGEPEKLLDLLYRERVRPRAPGGRPTFGRGTAKRVLAKAFEARHLSKYVVEGIRLEIDNEPYVFDLGIQNGTPYFTAQALSFRARDTQHVEEVGGWYAYVWDKIRYKTSAQALVFVEPPDHHTGLEWSRFNRVQAWTKSAGIEFYESGQIAEVANRLVDEVAHTIATPV
jgi:Protein of unknown function (DUF3037)